MKEPICKLAHFEFLRDDLSKVVLTGSYRKAAESLDRYGFVLLIGEPAAGKTTIATMMSIAAVDQWGSSTIKLDSPENLKEHWNLDDQSQFFWIDDAFGVTQYESNLAYGWNRALPIAKTMLRRGTKIVMTSRDYIYNRARRDLKEGAFPLFREGQVVIDVHNLTPEEREQILYNHIKLGRQDVAFRKAVKAHLPDIAAHPRFVPETARRLADPVFTKGLSLTGLALSHYVGKQELFLQEVIETFDTESKAALGLIYMRNGLLESPIELQETERNALERLGSNLGECTIALEVLNGSMINHTYQESTSYWRFRHPTIADAYSAIITRNPELLGIYIHGTPVDKLLENITCGDVGIEGAVVVPKSLFELVLSRLDEPWPPNSYKTPHLANWHKQRRVDEFLTRRCARDFLSLYLTIHPYILLRVSNPGMYLDAVTEVGLAARFHDLQLLPEKFRLNFVNKVVDYAISGEDLGAIASKRIQSVFSDHELAAFRLKVKNDLVPKLSEVREYWQGNYGPSEDPDAYLEQLLSPMAEIKTLFANDSAIITTVEKEVALGQKWIEVHHKVDENDELPYRAFGDVETETGLMSSGRNIFDDIDE